MLFIVVVINVYASDWVSVDGLSEGITDFTWVSDSVPERIDDTGALIFRWKTGRSKRQEPAEYLWYAKLRAAAQDWNTRLFDALYEAARVKNGATSPAHRRIEVLSPPSGQSSNDVVDGSYRMFTAAINANQTVGDVWGEDAYFAAAIIAYETRSEGGAVPTPGSFDNVTRRNVIEAHADLINPVPTSLLDVVGFDRALPKRTSGAGDRVAVPPQEQD